MDGTGQIQRNIAAVARLEHAADTQRSPLEQVSIRMARLAGSVKFLALHLAGLSAWIAINRPGSAWRIDPFPYRAMQHVLKGEAILLWTFVLISQNHLAKRADRLTHLSLQINLLAESEMTRILGMARAIAVRLGCRDERRDDAFLDLARVTEVASISRALDEPLAARMPPPEQSGGAS